MRLQGVAGPAVHGFETAGEGVASRLLRRAETTDEMLAIAE
jgi:hypothetical protein